MDDSTHLYKGTIVGFNGNNFKASVVLEAWLRKYGFFVVIEDSSSTKKSCLVSPCGGILSSSGYSSEVKAVAKFRLTIMDDTIAEEIEEVSSDPKLDKLFKKLNKGKGG